MAMRSTGVSVWRASSSMEASWPSSMNPRSTKMTPRVRTAGFSFFFGAAGFGAGGFAPPAGGWAGLAGWAGFAAPGWPGCVGRAAPGWAGLGAPGCAGLAGPGWAGRGAGWAGLAGPPAWGPFA
jgi:hypothetical protein